MTEPALSLLIDRLRASGLRVTAPRRAVCAVLVEAHGLHLTAGDIHGRLIASGETTINASTVYRTLESLEEAGLINHTHMGHGALVYHLADEAPHQHLICVRCGRTEAVPGSELRSFFEEITRRTGFEPDPNHVALSGICRHCTP